MNFRRNQRSFSNDDYSRYVGPDYRRRDPEEEYGPYDVDGSFTHGNFKFGREEFGRDMRERRPRESEDEYGMLRRDRSHVRYDQGHPHAWSRDPRSEGSKERTFVGLGPKGYRRSDERIHEDVCEALMQAPSVDASDIEVNVKDGCVTLTGTVEARQDKREAEDIIEDIPGVDDVRNELKVKRSLGGWIPGIGQATERNEKDDRSGIKGLI